MTTAAPVKSGPLSATQRRHFEDQGYLILRRLFSTAEMTAVAAEAERLPVERKDLLSTNNLRCRWQNHVDTGECLFETFDPIIDLGPECASLARNSRLLGVLAAI